MVMQAIQSAQTVKVQCCVVVAELGGITRMWIAIFFFLAILGLLAYLDTRKPVNYPPGPRWLPILGSSLTVHRLRKKTGYLYKTTTELCKEYGHVVGLKVGKDKIVIVDGYEPLKQMLTDDDFSGRPMGLFYETRTWGIRRGLLLTDEEFWQEQRRFVMRHLRDFGFGRRTMAALVEEESEDLVRMFMDKIKPAQSAIISMKDVFGVSVLNTLWTMMANNRYSPEDKEMKTLQNLLTELFEHIDMVGALFSQFPVLRYVAPELSGYNLFLSTHVKIWEFLRQELDKHNSTFKEGTARDLMDVYIEVLRSTDRKPSFSESQLMAVCMDLFMAGSETTSKTLAFAFLYLLLYPDVQRCAQEEIDRVVGRDRFPLLSDRANMPYCEALVLETIRFFMGQGFTVPHRALRDSTLQGYFIPKDTMLLANMNGVLMTNTQWDDPEAFRPDRFLYDNKLVVPDNYFPFGMGKHRCLGEILAKSNIFLFTTSLLQKFTFSVPPGQAPPTVRPIDGVTPAPQPYDALVTIRQ